MRLCDACQANIDHKRRDARYCDRACKMRAWHRDNRATPEGKAKERERNTARYANEADRRRLYAIEREHRKRANRSYVTSERDWLRLCRRYSERCAYCGIRATLTRDHVIPLNRGGDHGIGNILPACLPCNGSKGDSFLSEWRLSTERG